MLLSQDEIYNKYYNITDLDFLYDRYIVVDKDVICSALALLYGYEEIIINREIFYKKEEE